MISLGQWSLVIMVKTTLLYLLINKSIIPKGYKDGPFIEQHVKTKREKDMNINHWLIEKPCLILEGFQKVI
jgi:hypothetical protein